jgi:hypothetical protein
VLHQFRDTRRHKVWMQALQFYQFVRTRKAWGRFYKRSLCDGTTETKALPALSKDGRVRDLVGSLYVLDEDSLTCSKD